MDVIEIIKIFLKEGKDEAKQANVFSEIKNLYKGFYSFSTVPEKLGLPPQSFRDDYEMKEEYEALCVLLNNGKISPHLSDLQNKTLELLVGEKEWILANIYSKREAKQRFPKLFESES